MRFRKLLLTGFLVTPLLLAAEPVLVEHPEGSVHGYLALRSADGKLLAARDLVQTIRGAQLTSRLTYAEFRGYKLDWEEQRRARMRFIGWAAAAVLIVGIVGGLIALHHSRRPEAAQEMAQTTPPPTPRPDGEVPQKPSQNPPVAVDTNSKTDHPLHHPDAPEDGSVRIPKHTGTPPWFAKAGSACSIIPINRFVSETIFALKGGG